MVTPGEIEHRYRKWWPLENVSPASNWVSLCDILGGCGYDAEFLAPRKNAYKAGCPASFHTLKSPIFWGHISCPQMVVIYIAESFSRLSKNQVL